MASARLVSWPRPATPAGSPPPGRWSSTPAWRHASNSAAASPARTELTGQGRPSLRLAAWRAVWAAQRANPVYAARYQHLTSREYNKLTPTQARAAIVAAILRHLHAVVTTGRPWNPTVATHGHQRPMAA